ncbi:MAG: hypothetical protein U1E60_24185 [Reyranellaceae bacterium]
MGSIGSCVVALAIAFVPAAAMGQRSGDAYIEGRLTGLQQQLANLSTRIEQLRRQDQQFQQQLDAMQKRLEPRLERLEKGGPRSGRR